ncbi:MAG: hypothetical protein BWY63_03370 [Chloroflexi bacterium ADurb.Bin360]|nr:MAG: hypothetical protein BWY63_03370 [Chloroflexi bacterium ADurb.Bin360]
MPGVIYAVKVEPQKVGHAGFENCEHVGQDIVVAAAVAVTVTRECELGVAHVEGKRFALNGDTTQSRSCDDVKDGFGLRATGPARRDAVDLGRRTCENRRAAHDGAGLI